MPAITLLADIRILASVLIGLLGLAFLAHASPRSWPYVRWLAGSAVAFGILQFTFRALEVDGRISGRYLGPVGAAVGLLAWAAVLAGLQACLRPQGASPVLVFGLLACAGPVLVAAVHAATSGWAFSGPVAVATLFVGTAAWLLVLWRESGWTGLLALALAFLVHPLLLGWTLASGQDLQLFRQLTTVPITVAYLMVSTLILQRDAELLARELARREQAELDLQNLAATLDDKVQLRTRQLEDMVAGLQSFAGMVSHDLRGPLGNAGNLAQLAAQALHDGHPEMAGQWLRLIGREAGRATEMVDDLLRLAQVDQGPMTPQAVDLQALLDDCLATLSLQYPDAAAHVQGVDLPTVQADAGMLRHVLLNLLSNALKFGRGSPGLRVTVSATRRGDGWHFEVADNGPGFDPERSRELFRPFARLSPDDVPGSGIGLTVVRRVVERHGGHVGVSSTPGQGSTFWWTLPAGLAAMQNAGASTVPTSAPTQAPTCSA